MDWWPHKIQGWIPDFILGVLDKRVMDQRVLVGDKDAIGKA